jgi:hypothetical protein
MKSKKEYIIHFYPYSIGHKKSLCGISFDKLGDHTNQIKYVTCKKCKNLLKK